MSEIKLAKDGAAAVDKTYHWSPIDDHTPRGTKLQLIHRPSGVAVYGHHLGGGGFWTHWAPLPTFEPAHQTLQRAGVHPAPCARSCEAVAFRNEIRRLESALRDQGVSHG